MTPSNELTPREAEVAAEVLEGKSNKAIAYALRITESTVEFHLKNIYSKLGVGSRTEMILKLGKSTVANGTNSGQDSDNLAATSTALPSAPWAVRIKETRSEIGRILGMETGTQSAAAAGAPVTFVDAVRTCLYKYADFTGRAGRAEFWWFALFLLLVVAGLTALHEALGTVALIALLLPWLAVGTRRLRDAGYSGWWTLLLLAPVGGLVALMALWAQAPVEE
jgi:DNA-binding CsgD family transcriptional regulator